MLYYGKKTWYKKSSGRTFSRQGSSSTNWDLVGRELATLDELSKIPKGNCILFISTVGAFYSKLYNLKRHPNYADLYEPWTNNKEKYYNHKKELKYEENLEITSEDIIGKYKNGKSGYIKADQLFYFDKSTVNYYVLARIDED